MNVDHAYLSIGLLLGFGVLAVLAGTALLLERREVARDSRGGVDPRHLRIALAARLRPGHPWATQDQAQAAGGRQPPAPSEPGGPADAAPTEPGRAEPGDPCRDLRASLEATCARAAALRVVAEDARARLATAQRAFDEHVARREAATLAIDPRAVRQEKDIAQVRFRRAREAATDRATAEAAAAAWLSEINAINLRTKGAAAEIAREGANAQVLLLALEKAGYEADGTRLTAARAADGCRMARELLAACEERERVGLSDSVTAPAMTTATGAPASAVPAGPMAAARGGRTIDRLLQGDHATMTRLVTALAGTDPDQRRRWQLLLSDLADAIVARAIEATFLDFPERHVLWGAVAPDARRSVAAALAALGFRFDGMGGFADGRIPSQRDLALAVGEAGLQHARIRPWPLDADLPLLFRDVRVDAVGFLADEADGLTLGEMVDMLGRRAEPLAELWNTWGRLRPLLADLAVAG